MATLPEPVHDTSLDVADATGHKGVAVGILSIHAKHRAWRCRYVRIREDAKATNMPKGPFTFSQIHIDVARNSTDDFNPFHDPLRWKRINGNPFGSPIALGFQLEFFASDHVVQYRRSELSPAPASLAFRNFEFTFAGALCANEDFEIDVRKTVDKIAQGGGLSNRVVLRKADGKPVLIGTQSETAGPRFSVVQDLGDFPALSDLPDRSVVPGTTLFLKRKFLNTSNAKNFALGALCRQHDYIDELDERVFFAPLFTASMISCALLEHGRAHQHDFEAEPMVYTSHQISVDMRLQKRLCSNDRLHLLIQQPEPWEPHKGLGKICVPQQQYRCLGVIGDDGILFQAKVQLAPLQAFFADGQ